MLHVGGFANVVLDEGEDIFIAGGQANMLGGVLGVASFFVFLLGSKLYQLMGALRTRTTHVG